MRQNVPVPICLAVRFYNGNDWWNRGEEITRENHSDWFMDNGCIYFWENYNEDSNRTITVFAEVKIDDVWSRTNAISFTVQNNGSVGKFDFADDRDITVARGTAVSVNFEEAEGATSYWIDVYSISDGFSQRAMTSFNGTTVRISTIYLEPGTYEIRGRAEAPGKLRRESDRSVKLTITDEIPAIGTVTFVTPAMLEEIEEAFAGISAEVVAVSSNVEWIDGRAFANSGVKTVIFHNKDTLISEDAFEGCGNLTIYAELDGEVQQWADRNQYSFYPIQGNN